MPREKICAVYVIKNTVNGKVYVGGSRDILTRWYEHRYKLKRGTHRSKEMVADYLDVGSDAFEYSILEHATEDNLYDVEQKWLDKLRSWHPWYGYNTWPNAKSAKGVIRRPEDIQKLKGIPRKPQTEEARKSRLDKTTKLYEVTSPEGNTMVIKNLSQFCREHDLHDSSMVDVAAGKRSTAKGWKCRRLEPFLGQYI